MSLDQARLVDPVLTTHVQGYKNPDFVGMALFPEVDVTVASGQIVEFGREAFVRHNARRAPGSTTKRVPMGYFGRPYQLLNEALDAEVPRELAREAKGTAGVDLGMRAADVTMRKLRLGLEIDQATIARAAGNYISANKVTLSGSAQWSHADSDPLVTIDAGIEAIRQATGVAPNVCILPSAVYRVVRRHPKVRAAFSGDAGSLTVEQLARAFDVPRVLVAGAVSAATAEPLTAAPASSPFTDIWGKDVILAYAPERPNGMEEPSYGYTYRMKGHPFVEPARWDGDTRSWVYGVSYERAPVLSGMSAGYLIKDAVA